MSQQKIQTSLTLGFNKQVSNEVLNRFKPQSQASYSDEIQHANKLLAAEKDALQKQLAALQQKLTKDTGSLHQQLQAKGLECLNLQQQIQKAQVQVVERESQISILKAELIAEKDKLQKEKDELQLNLTAEIENLNQQVQVQSADFSRLQRQMKTMQNEDPLGVELQSENCSRYNQKLVAAARKVHTAILLAKFSAQESGKNCDALAQDLTKFKRIVELTIQCLKNKINEKQEFSKLAKEMEIYGYPRLSAAVVFFLGVLAAVPTCGIGTYYAFRKGFFIWDSQRLPETLYELEREWINDNKT